MRGDDSWDHNDGCNEMAESNTRPSSVAEPLLAPEWLADRLNDPNLLILDIRSVVDGGARQAYEAGHIPGTIHTDYAKDGWRAVKGMAAGLLPEHAPLSDLLGRIGLAPNHHARLHPLRLLVALFHDVIDVPRVRAGSCARRRTRGYRESTCLRE